MAYTVARTVAEQEALFELRPRHRLLMLPSLACPMVNRFSGWCSSCDWPSARHSSVDAVVDEYRRHIKGST